MNEDFRMPVNPADLSAQQQINLEDQVALSTPVRVDVDQSMDDWRPEPIEDLVDPNQ